MLLITSRRATPATPVDSQCKKPSGLLGRYTLWRMNKSHSKLTDWGLSHVRIQPQFTVLDVGCGGGRTVSKLTELATEGRVYGIDYSDASVAASRRYNETAIAAGHVEIEMADVAQLPLTTDTFDLVTAVETHFWWPDIAAGVREIRRVLKPGGTLLIVAEVYKGADTMMSRMCEKYAPVTGMKMLTPEEHRDLLASAAFARVQIATDSEKGWIVAQASKI